MLSSLTGLLWKTEHTVIYDNCEEIPDHFIIISPQHAFPHVVPLCYKKNQLISPNYQKYVNLLAHFRHYEVSKLSGSLTWFLRVNQKALEVSGHFSLECFLSKNRKGCSVSHTLTEVPYQCYFTGQQLIIKQLQGHCNSVFNLKDCA